MSGIWWVNGEAKDSLSADSRGLAYGDGLFETMRLIDGDLPLYSYHLPRLERGMHRLGLALDRDSLDAAMDWARSANSSSQSVVKLICTRAGPARGYQSVESDTDILLRVSPLAVFSGSVEYKAEICKIRLASQPLLAGLKHLNRLEQVLAARELPAETDEGILLDANDNLVEAISSNLIFVRGNSWVLPDLSESGVEGVMQAYIRDQAKSLGVSIETARVAREGLADFDEILLVNAVRGVRNLGKIGREWVSGSQSAGTRLREYLLNELHAGFHSF